MNNNQTGQCILLVEDEMLLGMMLEDLLLDAGYQVSRATGLAEALAQLDRVEFDAAILDIDLGGKDVFPLADRLRDGGIPFVFASASNAACIDVAFRQYPLIAKPYTIAEVEQSLERMLRGRGDVVLPSEAVTSTQVLAQPAYAEPAFSDPAFSKPAFSEPALSESVLPRTPAMPGSHVS